MKHAIPLLRAYITRQSDDYYRIAGSINLAEAYIATDKPKLALTLLTGAIRNSENSGYVRLLANALHLRAQALTALKQMHEASSDLERAISIYGKTRSLDALLIRRQAAFQQAIKERNSKPIRRFAEEARHARDWESARECDFQMLCLEFQPFLYEKLYFGTPYRAYHLRMDMALKKANPPDHFLWGDRGAPVLDLSRRTFQLGQREVKITKQNLAILNALLRDFYRPASVGEIFSLLFPGDFFDPISSPLRVHQSLKRLRRWLSSAKVPLELRCQSRSYSLRRIGRFSIQIPLSMRQEAPCATPFDALALHFGRNRIFSSKEVREALGVSKATACRLLSRALEQGQLQQVGDGRNTKYRLVGNERD